MAGDWVNKMGHCIRNERVFSLKKRMMTGHKIDEP